MRSGTIGLQACDEAPRRGAPGKFRIGGKKLVKTEGKLKLVAENLEKKNLRKIELSEAKIWKSMCFSTKKCENL